MTATATQNPTCPTCHGPMWDERKGKFWKEGRPIFKCKDKTCGGVIWPPRNPANARKTAPVEDPPSYGDMPEVDAPSAEDEAAARIEKLNRLTAMYRVFYDEALKLAEKTAKAGYVVSMDGVNAAAATLMIAADKRGLVPWARHRHGKVSCRRWRTGRISTAWIICTPSAGN